MEASQRSPAAARLEEITQSKDWASLVDLRRLAQWMDSEGLPKGPIEAMSSLSGGTQNVLLRFTRAGRMYLLRRPPLNPYLNGSETMRREARVLRALAASKAPHSRLIAACDAEDVLGAAFYLMEPIDGFCASLGLPSLHGSAPAIQHAMGLSAIDALAAVHAVDYLAAGLADFGKPQGFLARQVPRWLKQLDSYRDYTGWNGRADIPGIETIAAWLTANVPPARAPSIIHGDFHFGNVLFSPTGPDVRAIIDWELATIGDPLIDLGCLLATWRAPDGSHPGCVSVEPWIGFPTEDELVLRYAQRSGRDVTAINWYVVLACFKLGILQEGTYARAQAGKTELAAGEFLHMTTINLFRRALTRI